MKRILDVVIAAAALIVLSPLLAALCLVVLISDGAPVLFRQQRVGKDNRLFTIYKLRTMKKDTVNVSKKDLENYDACLIRGGHFLRRTSLDELPQLFNILNGTMSFVGPRPLIPEEEDIRRMRLEAGVYSVRPGVTGLAQVNGRDSITDEEKVAYDKQYVDKQSLLLDLKILCRTVGVVLTRRGMTQKQKE